ncbi:hypothetical protein BKA64DRAFT_642640 [Cadophora sp. MPI-SDFR-AT-0126]|nr:hypothetical protein BKA64DRAFT_642640 [Leotiomycetes sp. MPI-SDFR-AT-0126]
MKFFSILALVATSIAAIAMPAAEARGELGKRACREGDTFCGDCNGTSCKIAGINYECHKSSIRALTSLLWGDLFDEFLSASCLPHLPKAARHRSNLSDPHYQHVFHDPQQLPISTPSQKLAYQFTETYVTLGSQELSKYEEVESIYQSEWRNSQHDGLSFQRWLVDTIRVPRWILFAITQQRYEQPYHALNADKKTLINRLC